MEVFQISDAQPNIHVTLQELLPLMDLKSQCFGSAAIISEESREYCVFCVGVGFHR